MLSEICCRLSLNCNFIIIVITHHLSAQSKTSCLNFINRRRQRVFSPNDSAAVVFDAQNHIVHGAIGEIVSFSGQYDAGVSGSLHLEHDRGPTSQRHAHVDVLVIGNVERSAWSDSTSAYNTSSASF